MQPTAYADWKAPKEDGGLLIWPALSDLPEKIDRQRRTLDAYQWLLHGEPLGEVRRRAKAFIGHTSDTPVIATGHQTELHHPGVWVKNAVIHHLAVLTGGRAVHLAVDTDQPKHLTLRFPTSRDGSTPAAELALTDDPALAAAEWAGRLSAPSPVHATMLERQFLAASTGYGFESAAERVLASLRRASLEEGVLPPVLVSALHELDWSLGLRYDALLASPLWDYEGFLLLCMEMMSRADSFAATYNAALAWYRQKEGITAPGRPMPDLRVSADQVELPLWLDDLSSGSRSRLHMVRRGTHWVLRVGAGEFSAVTAGGFESANELRSLLRSCNHRIAPRALSLTMFMRLVLSDVFVHGIGGGRYDQITDRILTAFWGIDQPMFVVATATLHFPWSQGRDRACVPCVLQEGHRLRHAVLGGAKQRYLSAISESPRRSPARKAAFLSMHAELESRRSNAPQLTDWEGRLASARRAAEQDAVLFDRELFYALQPRERLLKLIDSVGSALR
jgi:hypothetical protein